MGPTRLILIAVFSTRLYAAHAACSDPPASRVDWHGCDKHGANLKHAIMEYANLQDADLTGADLGSSASTAFFMCRRGSTAMVGPRCKRHREDRQ